MYRYILRESCSQFDSLPLTYLLQIVRIFAGSFGGATLYANHAYETPNAQRSVEMKRKGDRYKMRQEAKKARTERGKDRVLPQDVLSSQALFGALPPPRPSATEEEEDFSHLEAEIQSSGDSASES